MKDILKNFWFILFVIVILTVMAIDLYLKFTNIDMTTTRLFITYWPIYITELAIIFGLYAIVMYKKK